MTAALASTGLFIFGALAVWATFYYAPARHAGSGQGALTVDYLIARVKAETSGGRHRLREREPRTVQLHGDLSDALANEKTRILPLVESGLPADRESYLPARDRDALARNRGMLRRILGVPEDVADTAPKGDPIGVRHRTVAAIEQAGYIVDRELWFSEGAMLCSQCHNGCYDDPPPKK
ncbi:hypothetical protein [Saccharopolyspora phatthalungensis]|uniref:Uncharacterized protein n=1 Tax=Saccharopolyspora phatthalungensis TaxID=664693 RepID=A0A840QHP3_9PSEU|nr:hypothetical protein [Saccharopolyspora phatthalungensis]MBB5160056.1 hypothetical protein [Saccharopolyspora phatthalungensis]